VDCRGCYTALATLQMLCLDKAEVLDRSGMVAFIRRCQVLLFI
jgi:prenyltransferase beta subunit